jgi:hypothetical protein
MSLGSNAQSLAPLGRIAMAQYIHIGIFLITVPNLIVIGLMLVVFAVAVAVSLPQEPATPEQPVPPAPPAGSVRQPEQ